MRCCLISELFERWVELKMMSWPCSKVLVKAAVFKWSIVVLQIFWELVPHDEFNPLI